MKYTLVQLVDLIFDGNYDYLLICNGIYEIDWITRMLTSSPKYLTNKLGNKTKLIVWSPIDYIPTLGVINNVINADLFLTMTPIMIDEITKILSDPPTCKFNWIPELNFRHFFLKAGWRKRFINQLGELHAMLNGSIINKMQLRHATHQHALGKLAAQKPGTFFQP